MTGLSVVLLTSDSERTLPACLESVQGWAGEIVAVDGGSSDGSVAVAERFGARVFRRKMDGFGAQKQFALEQARNEWVFLIDSDERATPELAEEVRRVLEKPAHAAYRLPRRNRYFGRWLKHGGKYPDYQTRLMQRSACRYSDDLVHERVVVNGSLGTLDSALEHDSYPDLDTWFRKLELFARFRADELARHGTEPSLLQALRFYIFRPGNRFARRYLLRLGFLDGAPGFLACVHDALTEILGYYLLSSRNSSR